MSSISCTVTPEPQRQQHNSNISCYTIRGEGIIVNIATMIAILAVAAMLFFAVRYIYKEKKKGSACIGCPYSASCPRHAHGDGCGHDPLS